MNKKQTKTDFIVENDPKPEKKVDTVSIEKLLKKVQLMRKSRECKKSNEPNES